MNNMPNDSINISMHGRPSGFWNRVKGKVGQKILDSVKPKTIKEDWRKLDKWEKIDEFVSDPMWNRGIIGATALITQPAIDSFNHRVDDETRAVAVCRKIGKIIGCTGVGMFVVRGPMRDFVKKVTNINGKSWYSKLFLPKGYIEEIAKEEKYLKNYRSALSMVMALGAMCITNFALDAPASAFITNYLNDSWFGRFLRNAFDKKNKNSESNKVKGVSHG